MYTVYTESPAGEVFLILRFCESFVQWLKVSNRSMFQRFKIVKTITLSDKISALHSQGADICFPISFLSVLFYGLGTLIPKDNMLF